MTLLIHLQQIPSERVQGIYTIRGVRNRLADRMLFLHPTAAASLPPTEAFVVSDLYRSAESSLQAIKENRGALPPGASAHGFGLAKDISVDKTMRLMGFKTKKQLDLWLEVFGWFCHRRDHKWPAKLKEEAHHYNFLGVGVKIPPRTISTGALVEAKILAMYPDLVLPQAWRREGQQLLKQLGLYGGEIDGKWGPLSTIACEAFQRCWDLKVTGTLDKRTWRTLAFVTARKAVTRG